jgi:hypothetical protein
MHWVNASLLPIVDTSPPRQFGAQYAPYDRIALAVSRWTDEFAFERRSDLHTM